MNLFQKISVTSCVAMISVVAVNVEQADAFSLSLESNGNSAAVQDNGSGDNDSRLGFISTTIAGGNNQLNVTNSNGNTASNGNVGGWQVNIAFAQSSQNDSQPEINLTSLTTRKQGNSSLIISAFDTFTSLSNIVDYKTSSSLSFGNQVTTEAFINNNSFSTIGPTTQSSGASRSGTINPFPSNGQSYTLKLVSTIAGGTNLSTQNQGADVKLTPDVGNSNNPVPEPLTMFSSLIALGFGGLLTKSVQDENIEEEV